MNIDTGHLKRLQAEGETEVKKLMEELKNMGYHEVPTELKGAAEKKLAGRDEAMVSLTSGGKLSKWAAQKRKERREAEKAEEASQKRNKPKA